MDEPLIDHSAPTACRLPPEGRRKLMELRERMLVLASLTLTRKPDVNQAPVDLNRHQLAEHFRHFAVEIQHVLDMAIELPDSATK